MSFPDSIRNRALRAAFFSCCWCRDTRASAPIEVHHIIPQCEGGPDTYENAVALCPNCHSTLQWSQDTRKQLQQRRDDWYARVQVMYGPSGPQAFRRLEDMLDRLHEATSQSQKAILDDIRTLLTEQAEKITAAVAGDTAVPTLAYMLAARSSTERNTPPGAPGTWGAPACPRCGNPMYTGITRPDGITICAKCAVEA